MFAFTIWDSKKEKLFGAGDHFGLKPYYYTMIDEDRYCGDVLIQLAAVESAVKAISREVMQDHLESCVVDRIQSGDT